jgi:esterase/lipase
MKLLKLLLALFLVAVIFYALGPEPKPGEYTDGLFNIPDTGAALQQWVAAKESRYKLKPDNQARIVWNNDSLKNRTKYAVVYLHGFTASQEEGAPTHIDFARSIGANLYLSRLSEHGKDTSDPLYNMTATSLWESAKEAYSIGKKLGDKVILMGTSTGGTLAIMLAAEQYPEIAGLVLLSPNIEINDPFAFLANDQWGLQIARLVIGGKSRTASDSSEAYKKYWNYQYRNESIVQVQQMLEDKMTNETFKQLNQPLLMLYYYKDDEHQDPVVRVSAMLNMFDKISTPPSQKRKLAVPEAGDHVLGSYIKSDDLKTVEKETQQFAADMGWTAGRSQ